MNVPPLVAVEEFGTGPPLVRLHGLATSGVIWAAVSGELSRTHRVLTVDLPGFGRSAPIGAGFELEPVAARIARGLAGRGVKGPYDPGRGGSIPPRSARASICGMAPATRSCRSSTRSSSR